MVGAGVELVHPEAGAVRQQELQAHHAPAVLLLVVPAVLGTAARLPQLGGQRVPGGELTAGQVYPGYCRFPVAATHQLAGR